MENQSTVDLPEECWESVFNRLQHHSHFESPSLVCKHFLSLTDRLRRYLTILDPTIQVHPSISHILRRFQNLVFIDLSRFTGNLDPIVLEIARSSLSNLETLDISNHVSIPVEGIKELGLRNRNLKVLRCARLRMLRDRDIVTIADALPFLEELDISYPNKFSSMELTDPSHVSSVEVTDTGIEALWSTLKNLLKLDISGNHFVTDKSIVALSSNCLKLKEVNVIDCSCITEMGIHFMLQNSPDISVMSICGIRVPLVSSLGGEPLRFGRALCSLDFCVSSFPDEYLCAIAKAGLPLKRFTLSCCLDFTACGVSSLLIAYQSLEYLALVDVRFLTDQIMIDWSQYLRSLAAIKLNLCSLLTSSTLFTLIKNCPLLQDIEMEATTVGRDICLKEFVKNPQVKSLNLARNLYMSDERLKQIASTTPNLEFLDVCSCPGITGRSIAEISESCLNIKHLRINDCMRIKELGSNIMLLNLEVLDAARSCLGDEGLVNIGKTCLGLLKLQLEGSERVGTSGVEVVVTNCKRLRELNLKYCHNATPLTCNWMVFNRPSLKKIIPPSFQVTNENQRRFLLQHGCQICEK